MSLKYLLYIGFIPTWSFGKWRCRCTRQNLLYIHIGDFFFLFDLLTSCLFSHISYCINLLIPQKIYYLCNIFLVTHPNGQSHDLVFILLVDRLERGGVIVDKFSSISGQEGSLHCVCKLPGMRFRQLGKEYDLSSIKLLLCIINNKSRRNSQHYN